MNKRYIEESIPKAIKLIKDNQKIYNETLNQVPNEFMGYVSSFAVAVTMSGAVQAVVFYNDNGSATFPRKEMLNVIANLMDIENLEDHLKEYPLDKEKLLDSAIAFKMALRVFELKKGMTLWD
ncbi:MAG: hypothetical protein U9N11_00370 [Campylobacterota bacterium]|nr:hypothetical protein [Campylobacterota bacterium]